MKLRSKGIADFEAQLKRAGDSFEFVAKRAVYDGCGTMIEAVKAQIRAIPEESGYMPEGAQRASAKPSEKEALLTHCGISKLEYANGKVSGSVSFDGYAENLATKSYPSGLPVRLIAASIESGSSVRAKYPFMRKAAAAAKQAAESAMREAFDEAVNKVTGE